MKAMLLAIAWLMTTNSGQSQVYDEPYVYHSESGMNSYGFGYTPIISGHWYWTYYGLSFPNWASYGYGFTPNRPYRQYAAIAYSPSTGRYGSAWGSSSRRAAVRHAVRFCAEPDCEPTVWVAGGCAALAVSEDGTALGWAYDYQRWSAERSAIRGCRRSQGEGCEVLAWACSG